MTTIKAAVSRHYGPPEVVKIEEIPTPSCKPNEVLVEVKASSVSFGDHRVRSQSFPRGMGVIGRLAIGITGPRQPILGTEFAGVVAHVGEKVTRLKVGDHVVGFPGGRMGAHAEKVVMAEDDAILKVDDDLDWKIGGSMSFGAITALHFLQSANVSPGESVLVIGASGAVGSAALQIATRHFGAHVTAICSAQSTSLMQQLGAADVIDYHTSDFRKNGKKYHVIMDCVGSYRYEEISSSLEEGGRFIIISVQSLGQMLGATIWPQRGSHRIIAGVSPEGRGLLEQVVQLVKEGKFSPLIEKEVPFERIVEAHALVATGRKKGNVVVTFP